MRRRTRGPYFNRGQLARGALVVAAAVAACAAGAGLSRGREVEAKPERPAISDPLSVEFRRCNALGYAALDDDGCVAAWAEHRHRFLMDRSRADAPPLPNAGGR